MADKYPDPTKALRDLLLSYPEVEEIVSTRVYADELPQTITLPAIVLWVISGTGREHLKGSVGVDTWRYQFNFYGRNRPESQALLQTVRANLVGYRGVVSGVYFKGIGQADGPSFRSDRPSAGEGRFRPFINQDFFVNFNSLQVEP